MTSTGYGVSAPLTERACAFGIGIAAFKLPLALPRLASPGAPTPTGAAIDRGGLLPAGVGLVLLGRACAGHSHR